MMSTLDMHPFKTLILRKQNAPDFANTVTSKGALEECTF